jgi:iron complex transport system substrate-binding protein
MKKLVASFWLGACLVLGLIPGIASAQDDTITLVDSKGDMFTLPYPVERIACLAPGVTEVICALDSEDKLCGIDNFTKRNTELYPFFEDVAGIGLPMGAAPNYEKIIDLDPDVVISLEESRWFYPELEERMKDADIPVMRINCWKPDTFALDVLTIGKMLDEEELAQEYIDFATSYAGEIAERVEEMDLDPEDKTRVYFEFKLNKVSCGDKSAEGQLLNMAGGQNIFREKEGERIGTVIKVTGLAEEPIAYYQVGPEAIIDRNPEVIVRDYLDFADAMKLKGLKVFGYTSKPKVKGMEKARKKLMDRAGWDEIDAVRDERVYMFAFGELCSSPKWPIALGYLAKWFYPDEFADLDPQEFHEEWLSKWHDVEYMGLYVYPEEE